MGTKEKKQTRMGLWWAVGCGPWAVSRGLRGRGLRAVGCGPWAVEQGQLRLPLVEEERALPSTGLRENLPQEEGKHEI